MVIAWGVVSRLHRQLMEMLIVDITSGVLREGQRLPPQSELATQFGVSRGIVRESLRGLEERGLVTVRHGRGATVSATRNWNVLDGDVVGALLQSSSRVDVLREFLECRSILEVEAAGLAAHRATAADLTRLAETLSRMSATAQRAAMSPAAEPAFHESDIAFHRAIIAASGNRVLSRLVEPIQRALILARRPTAHPETRMERALPEHKRILSAIASRDEAMARSAMADHLATSKEYLEEYAESLSGTVLSGTVVPERQPVED